MIEDGPDASDCNCGLPTCGFDHCRRGDVSLVYRLNEEARLKAKPNSVRFSKENGFDEWIHPMHVIKVIPYDDTRCIVILNQQTDFAVPVLGTVAETKEKLRLAAYAQLGLTPTEASPETRADISGK